MSALGWWIADYDQETGAWYETSGPASSTISGTVAGADHPDLKIGLGLADTLAIEALALAPYKVTTEVAPTANQQFSLLFADDGSALPVAKAWRLVVGTLA